MCPLILALGQLIQLPNKENFKMLHSFIIVNIVFTAPPDVSQNGAAGSSTLLRTGSTKLETLRNWGVSTYKCTKQILYEKLGKSSRTVDTGENCLDRMCLLIEYCSQMSFYIIVLLSRTGGSNRDIT